MKKKSIIAVILLASLLNIKNLEAQVGYFLSEDAKSFPVEHIDREVKRVLDNAHLVIDYSCSYIIDLDTKKRFEDHRRLLIGEMYSTDYSLTLFECDSISTAIFKSGSRNAPMCAHEAIPEEIFINKLARNTQHNIRMYGTIAVLSYEEPLPVIKWSILPEQKKIHSYSCQKAVAKFQGREYEAWFTIGIPISAGPYKFTGLPGLILELRDTEGHYHWECIGISQPSKGVPINYWDFHYQHVDKQKAFRISKNSKERFASFMQQFGHEIYCSEKTASPKNIKFLYNPIEKIDL